MAGEAATARVVRRRPLPESGDRANAARLARIATGGDDVEAAVLISIALEAATNRLEDDATWQRVERVAEALVARRALDADEFRDLVRA
jgi:hypothetical protein